MKCYKSLYCSKFIMFEICNIVCMQRFGKLLEGKIADGQPTLDTIDEP